MRYLIVTADDFGLLESVNEGIIKARREGIVTSLSLMPSGDAFSHAVRLAKETALSEVGAHISLTETFPVSDTRKVPTLVTKRGRFHKHYVQFLFNLFAGKIKPDQIYSEVKNQLERIKDAGLRITNLSSHEHIHMLPSILAIFIDLAKEYGIPAIRYPQSEKIIPPLNLKKIYKRFAVFCLGGRMGRILKDSGLSYTENFLGFLDSGGIEENAILAMLGLLKDGTTELVSHPGFLSPELLTRYPFHRNCEVELAALTSRRVKNLVKTSGIKLVTHGEFIDTSL